MVRLSSWSWFPGPGSLVLGPQFCLPGPGSLYRKEYFKNKKWIKYNERIVVKPVLGRIFKNSAIISLKEAEIAHVMQI